LELIKATEDRDGRLCRNNDRRRCHGRLQGTLKKK